MTLPTLRQLEYIVALADAGHFGAASRACGVSQPALSKQVREVEQQLGVALFERTRPRALPTAAGEEVVARARRLLADARDLVEAARVRVGRPSGTVRLGVIPTIAPYGLPGLLAKLRRMEPDVRFSIREIPTASLLDALRGGAVDLALLARPFDASGFDGEELVFEPFVVIAPGDHALGGSDGVTAAELVGASLILMSDGHCLRDQAIEVCAAAGAPPATAVTAASVSTLVRMVESGLGATLLPAAALSTELREGNGVVARGFRGDSPGRTLTLQWRASSPEGRWFRRIGSTLRDHYLEMNGGMPVVAGPQPRIRAAF